MDNNCNERLLMAIREKYGTQVAFTDAFNLKYKSRLKKQTVNAWVWGHYRPNRSNRMQVSALLKIPAEKLFPPKKKKAA